MAERIVKKVDQLNLIIDEGVEWDVNVAVIPRHNSTPRGFQLFEFGDLNFVRYYIAQLYG